MQLSAVTEDESMEELVSESLTEEVLSENVLVSEDGLSEDITQSLDELILV